MTKIRLCPTQKFAYVTYLAAESELRHFQSDDFHRHRDGHPPIRPYRCPHCGMFHLTSKPKRKRRAVL